MRWLVDSRIGQQSTGVIWLRGLLGRQGDVTASVVASRLWTRRQTRSLRQMLVSDGQSRSLPDQHSSSRAISLDDGAIHKATLPRR